MWFESSFFTGQVIKQSKSNHDCSVTLSEFKFKVAGVKGVHSHIAVLPFTAVTEIESLLQ